MAAPEWEGSAAKNQALVVASDLKFAARNLGRHRIRSAISLAAICFGVVALLLTGGFIEWVFWAMRDATIQTGLGHVHITRPGFRNDGFANPRAYLLPSAAPNFDLVRQAPQVEVVDQRLLFSGLASSGELTVAFSGEAVEPAENQAIGKILPVQGKNLSKDDRSGVLLGRGLAARLGIALGDRVTFLVSVPGGGINAVEAHVRGTFATQVKAYDDAAVRMPLALGRELLRVSGSHIWVLGLGATDQDPSGTVAFLKARLSATDFEVVPWIDLSDFYRKSVVLLSRQIGVVALLIAVIIVLGIANTLMMNVLERTGEIGTMLAIGARRIHVLRLFVLEGFLLGLLGGVLGIVCGYLLAKGISHVGIPMPPPPGRDTGYSAQIRLTLPIAALGFFVAIASSTLASLYPAWRASRLPIVDALRHNY